MKLLVATSNEGKARELKSLAGHEYEIVTLKDIGFTGEIPEEGDTFESNAEQKASYLFTQVGVTCIADDSGLVVAALNGAPGVHSARYAGLPANDGRNITKLLSAMTGVTERKAAFITVLCLKTSRKSYFFRGRLDGYITESPKGNHGFGYDPIFVPKGETRTLAEMLPEEKNNISHRAMALKELIHFLRENPLIQDPD